MTDSLASRRALRRRRRRRMVAGGAVVLVAAVLWVGFQGWQAQQRLADARDHAEALQRALAAGDQAEASDRLDALGRQLARAHDITSGPTWSVMGAVPLLGTSFDAVRTLTTVGSDLRDEGLKPLVRAAGHLSGDAFAPTDGRIALDRLPQLEEPVRRGAAAFADGADSLAAQGLDFVPGRVREPYERLLHQVSDAASALRAADDALAVLPAMLGAEGRRTYILAVQNNAEIRSSGGMPGSQALIRARNGTIRLTDQKAAADFGVFERPVLPQSEAERAIYDRHPTIFPADTNFTPEFPRTAELTAAMWQQRKGVRADGVVTLDVVTLGYLLEATGPVKGPDGKLTADNVVDEMLYGANVRYARADAQNAFYEGVTGAVTEAIFDGRGNASKLLGALRRGVMEGRVKVASFHEDEQEVLARSRIAGTLPPTDTSTPYVGVYVNDATGSKMSYFLRYRLELVSMGCDRGRQQFEVKATFSYRSPLDPANLPDNITGGGRHGTPAGEQLLLVRVYGPAGGQMAGWTFDGEPIPVPSVVDRGRPVASPVVQLRAGEDVVVRWRIQSGPGQTETAQLDVTPSVEPGTQSGPVPTRCGVAK